MNTRRLLWIGLAVTLVAASVGGLASRTFADGPVAPRFDVADPPAAHMSYASPAEPNLAGIAADDVLDKAEYRAASDFARRVTPYVHLGDDGIPRLDEGVGAAMLGVDARFLADFERALAYAGQAIRDGRLTVAEDLTVKAVGPVARGPATLAGSSSAVPAGGGAGSAAPDWESWRYNSGAMFYNSHEDYFSYFFNRYYILCSSMAAQIGYPWMSNNLIYFYAYNGWSFNRYCGANAGMYWFMPYSSSGCNQYYPCYCCGISYRPIYIWVMTYQYYPSCRCQQAVWGWQGFWARY